MNKSIEGLAKRLIDENGNDMVDSYWSDTNAIYGYETDLELAVVGDYILGEDGKPKNFNPFSNGTYRRRK